MYESIALFYYTPGNLELSLRSSLQIIQFVAVVRSPLVEKYGIGTILGPFMTTMTELEKVKTTYICTFGNLAV